MGCRCNERSQSIKRAGVAVASGQFRAAAKEIKSSVQSFAQDAASAQARRQMLARLAQLKRR